MSHSHWSPLSEGQKRPEGNASSKLIDLESEQEDLSPTFSNGFEDKQKSPVPRSVDPAGSPPVRTMEVPTGRLLDLCNRSSSLVGFDGVKLPAIQAPQDRQQTIAKKPSRWVKATPQLDKKDAERQSKEQKDAVLANLRREPPPTHKKPISMAFVWPSDGPEVEDVLGVNLGKLDNLRERFGVNVYQHTEIRVAGTDEAAQLEVIDEIRKRHDDAVSNDIRIRAYLVEPPPGLLKTYKIALANPDPFSRAYIRSEVSGLSQGRVASLSQLAFENENIEQRNYDRLIDAMKKCLSQMKFSSGFLRMRVHFGTFILSRFPKFSDDDPGFDFEDFCKKLEHERVEGRVVPGLNVDPGELLKRCSLADFLSPMNRATTLSDLLSWQPVYSASFEFFTKTADLIRLEVLFEKKKGSCEAEIKGHSWSKARRGNDFSLRLPLQIGVIDFANSDWQVDIEFFEKPEANSIKDYMEEFLKSIKFNPSLPHNPLFYSEPCRKVQTSGDVSLVSVVEKTAIQFEVKLTTYIFELARFDQYSGNTKVKPDSSSWGATLFDPAWDGMLGADPGPIWSGNSQEFSNPREEGVTLEPFTSFFPRQYPFAKYEDDDEDDGFNDFLEVVQRISGLLGPSQSAQKISRFKPNMRGFPDGDLGTLF